MSDDTPTRQVDLGRGAWIRYDPAWIPPDEASSLFDALRDALAWQQRPIVVAGREVMQPRLIAWAGDVPYRYSGQTLEPVPASELLAGLIARASEAAGGPFNHVLLNRYRDGRDNMGFHADDEPELGRNPLIAALSLGAVRKFALTPKGRRRTRTLRLGHGSLLVMGGTIQHSWYHAVPREARCTEERINVTFRYLHPPGSRGSRGSLGQQGPPG